MSLKCLTDLQTALCALPDTNFPTDWTVEPEICPADMNGDITVNTFRFARFLGQKPDDAAETVAKLLETHEDVAAIERIKGFVNITLKPAALFRDTLESFDTLMKETLLPEAQRRKITIEFSAPNTNKPQHLGHVRNNTLGMSLHSLLKRVGHDAVALNLVNDRGIHICKSMIAYERFGNDTTPESTGIKGDHFVGNYYVKFNQELERQVNELKAARPEVADKSTDELFADTEIGLATQQMLRAWEDGDENVRALWAKMNGWVLAGFEETYTRMGIKFSKTYYESDTYILGKDIVNEGLEKGVFLKRDDSAVYAPLGKNLGNDKIVLRSDGTSVYITQDLGTTLLKQNEWHPDRQIWVVGDEQILHFKQLFEILKRLGYPWAEGLYHLSYGMVNLPSGKMKSREGTVVDADDLFDEMSALAREKIEETAKEGLPADIAERAETIGMGALKFMLLKFNAKTTIAFDPQASVRFEGDTGPYVQYACARIGAILRKAAERGITPDNADLSLLSAPEEKALAVRMLFWSNTLHSAAAKMDCSPVTLYLLELAKLFSRFYSACPVLAADSEAVAKARLELCRKVREILVDGLHTLTINVPEAM